MKAWMAAIGVLAASTAMAQNDVSRWVQERAREHAAFLSTDHVPAADALFRERGPGQGALPDFVPPKSLAPLIRAVRTGVVNISTVNADAVPGASARSARQSLGSGFIISTDGYVVTNNHVVAQARQIRVNLTDGRKFFADIVGRDPSTDVALLKLRGDVGELPFTYLGDSDALEVGDWVLAIGNPFGLDHSVSHGMISAKERVLGIGVFDDFIQ
ncbi:MAG TPA: trypsin-like peptidase domain-containing protein, partial [Gemmatimonadaceae bacterium]|nr:trypsin-like peptidase domain-containing protein [Gemmatimonadaceae bacterium]